MSDHFPRLPRCVGGLAVALLAFASLHAAGSAPERKLMPRDVDLLELPAALTHHGEHKLLLQVTATSKRLVAVGEGGLVIRSDDQGKTWRQSRTPVSVMLTGVAFVDDVRGWAVGHDGLILSTQDGGATWRRQFDGTQANQQMLAAARRRVDELNAKPAAGAQAEPLRELADDRLAEAEAAVLAGPSRPLLNVAFLDARRGFAVGAFGQAFETRDGGQRWTYFGDRIGNLEGLHLNAVVAWGRELYIAAEAGRLFHSVNAGEDWQAIDIGYAGPLYGVVGSADTAVRVAFGFNGRVFRCASRDGRWQEIKVPATKALVAGFIDKRGWWLVAQDGQMLLSRDEAQTFEVVGRAPGDNLSDVLPVGDQLFSVGVRGVQSGPFRVLKTNK